MRRSTRKGCRTAAPGVAALGLAGLFGCVSLEPHADPTRYWVLTALDSGAAAEDAGGIVIGLRHLDIPAYLAGASILVRRGQHGIAMPEFDLWAEPLEQGVTRVLKRALAAHPRIDRAVTMPFPDLAPACEIAVHVWACEGQDLGTHWNALMTATWEVFEPGPDGAMLARGELHAPPTDIPAGDFAGLAAALSAALGQLASAIADSIPQVIVDHAGRDASR